MKSLQSLHSYTVPLVQWSTRLLPVIGARVQSPGGYLCETGILLLALFCYICDSNVIDHCGLVWCGLCPKPSLDRPTDNVIIPLDLTQLFCPSFTLTAGPASGFTTDIVGCWGKALCRACNLTAFIHSSTGPVVQPFASCHRDPGSFPRGGGHLCETRDSAVSVVLLHNHFWHPCFLADSP